MVKLYSVKKKKKGFEDSLFFSSFFKPEYCSLQGIFIVVKSGLAYSSGSDLSPGSMECELQLGPTGLSAKLTILVGPLELKSLQILNQI